MASVALKLGVACLVLATVTAMPNIDESLLDIAVFTEGDEAVVECIVRHIDNYTVLWKKIEFVGIPEDMTTLTAGNVRVTTDDRISVIHEKDSETWLLSIAPSRESDSGRYVCEVNTSPPLRVYKILQVAELPDESPMAMNYSECCQRNNVPSRCLPLCNFDNPDEHPIEDASYCSEHLQTITKCLTDGRDHMPCCVREGIPEICRSVCRGDYHLATVLQHYTCSKFALPTLACIAEGLQLLPGPPKELTAEAISSTQLQLHWIPPHQPVEITHYQINVTQLHEFDENGKLKEDSEDGKNRESKTLLISDQSNQNESVVVYLADGNSTYFIVENLQPLTMYEINVASKNEHGSSMPTYSLRVVTLAPNNPSDTIPNQSNVTLPDVRGCCEQQGVELGRCLKILCDPAKADETRMTDVMICAPWANVTFQCMAGGVDHSPCCRERGVPEVCLEFCSGTIKRVDYRHFICLDYMPHYSGCLLNHYGVISSSPENFSLTTVHSRWALLRWDPPEKLADTVLSYNLHWRNVSAFEDLEYNVIVNVQSPYLLDDLNPSVRYEAYVVAENSYGVSRGSSRIVFATAQLPLIPEGEDNQGYNETQCCFTAGLPEHCMPLCSYQLKMKDLERLAALCIDNLPTLLRCGAGGRDHTPCCERRQVDSICLPLCAGTTSVTPFETAIVCEQDIADIIQCMEEGNDILPEIPIDFEVTTTTPTSIHIQWNTPASSKVSNFTIFYEKLEGMKTLHPANYSNSLTVNLTAAVIGKLKPDTTYSLYVVSLNEFGSSLPSSVLTVHTPVSGINDTKVKATLSPPYEVEISFQTVDSLTVEWKPPLHVPPDAYLSYLVYFHLANATFDLEHDGNEIATILTSITLRNLSVNTEYAVSVRARSGHGESALSEIVMAWTDQAVPSVVHAPLVIPNSMIVEGNNVTILCIGSGMPVPSVSVYVNGNLMKEAKQRHVAYTIVGVKRNVTNVGCYATNGYGLGSQSWQDIRVGFKPTVNTVTESVKGIEGQAIRLQCVVSGHPEPRVIWLRDLKGTQTIRGGPGIDIQFTPVMEEPSTYLASLILKKASKSDEGRYHCKAENRFGSATTLFHLTLNGHDTGSNVTACCIQNGVTEQCLGACAFDVDIDFALSRPQCISDLNKIMICAADGSDHQQCCRRRGVPRICTRWCRGYPVFNTPICALIASKGIVSCFEEGRSVLPGIPQNVNAEFSDGTVSLEWQKPFKNREVVQWYRIFWRPVGTKDVFRNQTRETNFKIQGLKPGQTYEIFIKAGNHYGQSQSTNPTVVYIPEKEESESSTAIKVAVGIVVTVLLLVLIGVVVIYFKLKYRPNVEKGVSFENPTYMKDSISLQDTGCVTDNVQKNSEPQRAVANIYEEPKSCNGQ